ncbi:hypothetical protein YC2023_121521 [Brassica napus]
MSSAIVPAIERAVTPAIEKTMSSATTEGFQPFSGTESWIMLRPDVNSDFYSVHAELCKKNIGTMTVNFQVNYKEAEKKNQCSSVSKFWSSDLCLVGFYLSLSEFLSKHHLTPSDLYSTRSTEFEEGNIVQMLKVDDERGRRSKRRCIPLQAAARGQEDNCMNDAWLFAYHLRRWLGAMRSSYMKVIEAYHIAFKFEFQIF